MEKNKNGGIIIFLVICIFVALAAGLFGGYKYYELKISTDDDNIEDSGTAQESLEIGEEIRVIDYINYSIDKTGTKNDCDQELGKESIILPMLTSRKKGVLELNNAIREDLKHLIDASNRTKEQALNADASYSASYGYIVNEKYITLHIVNSGGRYCGTGSSTNYYYIYDIRNDNYLTESELLDLYNVSIDNLKSRIKNDIDIKHGNDGVDYYNRIVSYIEQGDYGAYIDVFGALVLEFRYTLMDTLTYTYWEN